MKILMLADVFFPDTIGGAGRVVYHLSLELSRKGHEVHVITRNKDGKLPFYQKIDTRLFVHRFFSPLKESPCLFLSEIKNSYLLCKHLSNKMTFDAVCIHQSLVAIGPLLSTRFRKIPLIYYFHSPWHEEFLIKKKTNGGKPGKRTKITAQIMRRIEKRILFKAVRVIVLSRYMFNKILEIHHYPENRVIKIPGGVDLNRFNLPAGGKLAAKGDAGLPLDKTLFFTVRNLVPRMGLESLIKAFNGSETLREKGLLLIGGKGFLAEHLKSMVDNSNLQESIRFLGHVPEEDLPQMYRAANFFVLPTRKLEGFGLVILEAMACGTPVLGTPIGAIPELIGPFDGRLIFDGTGWLDIKKKMEEVIVRPDKFQFDPHICRTFVEENFSWEKVVDTFEKEVMSLVKC